MSGQLRICGGELRSRQITVPKSGVRPTSDRVREAVFSTLYSLLGDLDDTIVLDAFAGSGALGIEAISRGARQCVFYEKSSKTQSILQKNFVKCGISQKCKLISAPAQTALDSDPLKYDVIFIDPPYAQTLSENFWNSIQSKIHEKTILCVERDKRSKDIWPDYLEELKHKKYGDTHLYYFRAQQV